MRATSLSVMFGLLVALASACGSSSTSPSEDAGPSTRDTGVTDSSKSDGGKSNASSRKDGADEAAACDAGTFTALDAAMTGMDVTAACEACIQTSCLTKAQACFETCGCKAIEACGLSCIANGGAAGTCVLGCIQSASPDGSTSFPAQQASIALSYCLQDFCTSECN